MATSPAITAVVADVGDTREGDEWPAGRANASTSVPHPDPWAPAKA